jgi:hypothetical protein
LGGGCPPQAKKFQKGAWPISSILVHFRLQNDHRASSPQCLFFGNNLTTISITTS